MLYANIAFPLAIDQLFTYAVPPRLDAVVQPGVRVLAPFRQSTQEGVVVERIAETDLNPAAIRNISDCLDEHPMFSPALLSLTRWMADYYVSSWGSALFCAVPAAVRSQKQQRVQLKAGDKPSVRGVQKEIVALLEAEGELSPNQLARRVGVSYTNLRPKISALREKGVVDVYVTPQTESHCADCHGGLLGVNAGRDCGGDCETHGGNGQFRRRARSSSLCETRGHPAHAA